jgi:hypothetical protein
MYIKYNNGIRHSIIKECEHSFISDSKIMPIPTKKEVEINKDPFPLNSNESKIIPICNNKIDEKITNFFFSAIHQNYLNNRKR